MKNQVAATQTSKSKSKSKSATSERADIIEMILEDHKPLKELIEVMKEPDNELSERKEAFQQFSQLLPVHAKSEEDSLYVHMKEDDELRAEAFEGDTEHALAEQLLNEIPSISDEDVWTAKVKVLAELVEHHIEEEEEELLPDFKKRASSAERAQIGEQYLELKLEYQGGEATAQH